MGPCEHDEMNHDGTCTVCGEQIVKREDPVLGKPDRGAVLTGQVQAPNWDESSA